MQQDTSASTKMMKPMSSAADIFTPPPYSSIFFHSASPASCKSPSFNYDAESTKNSTSVNAAAARNLSRIMSEHKELLSRHAFCLNQLRKTFKEAETLRQENTNLRLANVELSNHVNLLIQATLQNRYQAMPFSDYPEQFDSSPLSATAEKFCGGPESGDFEEEFYNKNQSRTSVNEKNQEESAKDDTARVSLPKSISVRSNGFLKMSQMAAGSTRNDSAPVRPVTRIRSSSPVSGPQKVYVRGGSKKDGPIELEVYNQGMFKTELCNKWQETKTCPYGDHCQFAHGIEELRPVIRHPRYKTEVCRMVLAGDPCPYGHRCHFRHALTDEEKLMHQLKLN